MGLRNRSGVEEVIVLRLSCPLLRLLLADLEKTHEVTPTADPKAR
jgi:hypothetical protein